MAGFKKILVCGGRDYNDKNTTYRVLDTLLKYDDLIIIHGGARGADTLADQWAKLNEVPHVCVPAKWKKYDRQAGPIRNRYMLKFKPDLVIAFPGGYGTQNMIKIAEEAGIKVERIA